MLKDIPTPKVEDVSIAVVKDKNNQNETVWYVYLINQKEKPIKDILVTSSGYGQINDENRKTSTLRHFFELLEGNSFVKIEPIIEDVFILNNEYWLSFYLENQVYDKKFIFIANTINDSNLITIPLINKKGVWIR